MAVAGLNEELQKAGLERCLEAAAAWCDEMGPRDLDEIGEPDVFEEFATALGLKPLERRRLLKGRLGASGPSGYQGGKPAVAPQTDPLPSSRGFVVKNTFLDYCDSDRAADLAADLQRSSTTPAPTSAFREEEREEEEEEEPTGEEAQAPALENPIYKTMTFDSWEHGHSWEWVQGQSLEAVGEQEEMTQDLPAQQPEAPDPVGMMFIPMEAMPSYAMPLVPPEMCLPAGCYAVPMDRFGRFPGAMEQMPPAVNGTVSSIGTTTTADNTRAQVLQRAFSVASNVYRVRWTVDARKLESNDREAVSPSFEMTFAGGEPVPFKMIMRPKVVAQERGGASFRRSKGKGNIQLRCMAESDVSAKPVVTFRLMVGSEKAAKQLKPRGPVCHDFSEKNICGLPKGQDEWDFRKAVDEQTQTFVVCLEILSAADARS